jgi:hypothetical protein
MCLCQQCGAQTTEIYHEKEFIYKNALDLFNKQKYAAAQKEFELALKDATLPLATRDNCEFYIAWCAAMLYNREAEYIFASYLDHYPVSQNRPKAIWRWPGFTTSKKNTRRQ